MEDPWDKLKHERNERKQKGQETIATLYATLDTLLEQPQTPDTLEQQAEILNAIFGAVMRRNVIHDKESGHIDTDKLELALRVQKQCTDALKTRAAIDYMEKITAPKTQTLKEIGQGEPHPLLTQERNGLSNNDN